MYVFKTKHFKNHSSCFSPSIKSKPNQGSQLAIWVSCRLCSVVSQPLTAWAIATAAQPEPRGRGGYYSFVVSAWLAMLVSKVQECQPHHGLKRHKTCVSFPHQIQKHPCFSAKHSANIDRCLAELQILGWWVEKVPRNSDP